MIERSGLVTSSEGKIRNYRKTVASFFLVFATRNSKLLNDSGRFVIGIIMDLVYKSDATVGFFPTTSSAKIRCQAVNLSKLRLGVMQ